MDPSSVDADRVPYNVKPGRVPLAELGAYATLGQKDGWGMRADGDGLIEVDSPFLAVAFRHLPNPDRDIQQARYACATLRMRDRELLESARYNTEHFKEACARRAGAALWLFRRDLRRFSHRCTGVAEGWSLHPTCQTYNDRAHEDSLSVGARTSKDLHLHLGMHLLQGGVFFAPGWVSLRAPFARSGIGEAWSTSCADRTPLGAALHAEMVALACRLAEAQAEAKVAAAQTELGALREQLSRVPSLTPILRTTP